MFLLNKINKFVDFQPVRPVAGSLTAQRGEKAKMHLNKELRELCEVIYDLGIKPGDGRAVVTFGELFQVSLIDETSNNIKKFHFKLHV